jgi:hypothetical protein
MSDKEQPNTVQSNDSVEPPEDQIANYKFEKGANWESDNVRTLLQWIHISAIYIDVLIEAASHYRRIIRRSTILNLLLSTLASTVSLSQFNLKEAEQPELSMFLKVFFSVSTVVLALSAGFLKVYQIQEKLEKSLQLQQEWIAFGSKITSEMQLPVHLRKDALFLLIKLKETYANLVKQQATLSGKIISRVAARNGMRKEELTLSDLFERILKSEADRIKIGFDSVAGIEESSVASASIITKLKGRRRKVEVLDEERCKVTNAIMSPMPASATASAPAAATAAAAAPAPATVKQYSDPEIETIKLDVISQSPDKQTGSGHFEFLSDFGGFKHADEIECWDESRKRFVAGTILSFSKKDNSVAISVLCKDGNSVLIVDSRNIRKVQLATPATPATAAPQPDLKHYFRSYYKK